MNPRPKRRFLALALLGTACVHCAAGAATWYVDAANGNDAAGGQSLQAALRSLDRAVKKLRGGDTLVVGPGEYYHAPLVIENLGSSKQKPVWILARPRGMATISGAWREAVTGRTRWTAGADGIYSAPHAIASVYGGYNGHYLFRYESLADLESGIVKTKGRYGTIKGPEYGFAVQGGNYYVRLPGREDPNGKKLVFSLPWYGEKNAGPVIRVFNSPGLIFDGFRIVGGGTFGIQFDPKSPAAIVRNCIIEYTHYGVGLAEESLVEWSEYSYPGFYEFSEHCRQRNGGRLVTYPLVKDYGAVRIEAGIAEYAYGCKAPPKRCEFRYNYMHDCFDGEKLGAFDDSESHHNVYLHCYDNSIELEGWHKGWKSRNLRFHHNLLLSCPSGHISHQQAMIEGPHYVYRNVVVGYDDHGWNPWTVIKSKCPNARGLYYYHNLFWMKRSKVYWRQKAWEAGLRTMVFKNNIFAFEDAFTQERRPDEFTADHNILAASRRRPSLVGPHGKHLGTLAQVGFVDPAALDFRLTPGSPAVDAGVRVPGFNDEAQGTPDIGPFELGETPGPDWPRPRRTVFNANPPARLTGKTLPPKIVIFDPKRGPASPSAPSGSVAKKSRSEQVQERHSAQATNLNAGALAEWESKLRKSLAAAVGGGKRIRTYLHVFGPKSPAERAWVVGADERNVFVEVHGSRIPLPWARLPASDRAALAKAVADDQNAVSLLTAAVFLLADKRQDQANTFFAAAGKVDKSAVAAVKVALGLGGGGSRLKVQGSK